MDMLLILFIITFMIGIAFDLGRTLDKLVVKPLERLLSTVKKISNSISCHVRRMSLVDEEGDISEDNDETCANEAELLERAFDKFAKIAALSNKENIAVHDWDNMTHEGKGVMADMMNVTVRPRGRRMSQTERRKTITKGSRGAPSMVAGGPIVVGKINSVATATSGNEESQANLPNIVPPRSPKILIQ